MLGQLKETNKISFQYLFERWDLAPLLAQWIYNEFWTDIEGVDEGSILERFKEAQNAENLPRSR